MFRVDRDPNVGLNDHVTGIVANACFLATVGVLDMAVIFGPLARGVEVSMPVSRRIHTFK